MDFEGRRGTLTYYPGGTLTQAVWVPVIGDTMREDDEDFFLDLFSPTGGATVATGRARAVILDDDPLPAIGVEDATVTEGDGPTPVELRVRLSAAAGIPVSVSYATRRGSAEADVDFDNASGTVTFPPGTVERPIALRVRGDTAAEPDEVFFVELLSPVGAVISRNLARVTIVDDDAHVSIVVREGLGVGGSIGATRGVSIAVSEGIGLGGSTGAGTPVAIVVREGIGAGDRAVATPSVSIAVREGIGADGVAGAAPAVGIEVREGIGAGDAPRLPRGARRERR